MSAVREGTAGLYKTIKKLQVKAELARLEGQIQGIEYVRDSLCSCEIKPGGRGWLQAQIDERKTRLKTLQDERLSEFK